jgi:hypothetical protein
MESSTIRFADAARVLTREARRRGLLAPGFRCPPRLVGVDRTLRRRTGAPVVSVRIRGRPWPVVLGDMIEGVIVANALPTPDATRLRTELWGIFTRAHGPAGNTEVA